MTSSSPVRTFLVPLRTAVADLAGVRVVHIHGELDSFTAPIVREAVRRQLARRPAVLAVDLSELEFLGVAGLNALLWLRQVAAHRDTALVLTGTPRPIVARLLHLVGWAVTRCPQRSVDARGLDPLPCSTAVSGMTPSQPMSSELPSSAFQHDPELIAAFVENQLDDSGREKLAEQVARLLPFHPQLPNPIRADLAELARSLGGDDALLCWLDRHPGQPRTTARLFRVIALLDFYTAAPGVLEALGELRAHDPYPCGLADHLLPDTTRHTLASMGEQIASLLADDRPDEATWLSLRSLALLAEIAPRAAELDQHAGGLATQVDNLRREIHAVASPRDNHDDNDATETEPG